MKKFLIAVMLLMISLAGLAQGQFIRGSVKKNADPTKIDIMFKSNYSSAGAGEFITQFQFSLAIPVGVSAGVTATAVGVGPFANLGTMINDAPPSYTEGTEQIYSFFFTSTTAPTPTNFFAVTNGVEFAGVTVTFSTTAAAAVGKMVDFTNNPISLGGGNVNTFFVIGTSSGDKTDYTCPSVITPAPCGTTGGTGIPFFAISGESFLGIYPYTGTGADPDNFVQTGAAPTGCSDAVGGTAAGSTSFCISGTPTITASGYSSGSGSGYQWMSSTTAGDYPLAGSPVAGQTNPASLTTGVVNTTTYYWLKVTCTSGTATDYSNMITVTINSLPTVTCPSNSSVCITAASFALGGGLPAGGTYSGTGVSGSNFDPAIAGIGTHTITYSYTDLSTTCSNSCTFTITVNAQPVVTCPGNSSVCINTSPFALAGGLPAGGTYSGTGVSGGNFDPAVAGAGVKTITYSYTDPVTTCSNSCTFTITVNALPVVTCPVNSSVCTTTASFALTGGSPGGGTYSGTGVSAGNFDPAAAGTGTHTITYSYTDPVTTCSNSCTFTITVTSSITPGVSIAITSGTNPSCAPNNVTFTATATNTGGGTVTYDFKVGGISVQNGASNTFTTSSLATGNSVTSDITITGGSSCLSSTTASSNSIVMTVNPQPLVTCPGNSSVCINAGSFALIGSLPVGGTYSGTGVSGGSFDPTTAGAGSHIVTYSYTDIVTGCSNSCTFTITVNALPVVNNPSVTNGQITVPFSQTFTQTGGSTPVTFTTASTLPGGLTLSAAGVLSGTPTGTGTFPIIVRATDPIGCFNDGPTYTLVITAGPTSSVLSVNGSATICSGSSTDLIVTITGGTSPYTVVYTDGTSNFTVNNYVSGTNIVVSPGTTTTYSIVSVTDANSNPGSGNSGTPTITVNPTPSVAAMTATACSSSGFTITPVNGTNGVVPAGTTYSWSAPTVTGGMTGGASGTNASDIIGTLTNPTIIAQTATYTVTPTSGTCVGSTFTLTITVNPTSSVTAMTTTICSGSGFTLTPVNGTDGSVPVGTTYTWSAPVVTGGMTGGASANNASSITGTLTNPTNIAQTATYTVLPRSGPCLGSTFTVTVTVNSTPSVTAMTATACNAIGFAVTPVNGTDGIVPAGTTYSWSAPVVTGGMTGGASGTNASGITGTLTNPTIIAQTATYTVTPTSGTCVGSTFTLTITVNPIPSVTAMTTTICSGSGFTVTPANSTNGVVPAGTTYSWSAPTVTGGMTGGASGTNASSITGTLTNPTNSAKTATYTVTPTTGTCAGSTFTVTVTVNPKPSVTSITATTCSGFTITPVNVTNGIVPAGTTYSWSAPIVTGGVTGGASGTNASSITGTLNNPTNVAQTATYTVTATSGTCVGSTAFTVTVTVNPAPILTISSLPSRICLSDTLVNLVATPAGGVWSGAGVIPNTSIFSPIRAAIGTFTLTYTFTTTTPPCSATATVSAKVEDCPERSRSLKNNGVILFPNPSIDGLLNIRVNTTLYSFLGINVYSRNGSLVHRQNFTNLQFGSVLPINLRKLAAGVYMVKVFYESGVNRVENSFNIIINGHY